MKEVFAPINGIVEPDFLEYLARTFYKWQQLHKKGVTLGTREIAKFTDVVMGAKLNAHLGFEAVTRREYKEEEDQEYFVLLIYKNPEAVETDPPLYSFSTPIFK